MKFILKMMRFCRMLLFAFMFAVCMVIGVAPVIPKRKEEFAIEVKITKDEKKDKKENVLLFKK